MRTRGASPKSQSRRAFTMLEALVTLAVLGVLAALLALFASDSRRNSGLGHSIANLKRLGVSSFSYAGDNKALLPMFWWSKTEGHSDYPDLENIRQTGDGVQPAMAQAVDIIRRRWSEGADVISSWIPHVGVSMLVLVDYLDDELPAPWLASPGDKNTQSWQKGIDLPSGPNNYRWRFWSSYEVPAGFWGPEGDEPSRRIRQSTSHISYLIPTDPLIGRRSFEEIAFPSEKALSYERFQRYFGQRVAYVSYPEARVPILFSDGSVSVRTVGEANVGWDPHRPTRDIATVVLYSPDEYEPPTLSGETSDRLLGMIRWTRGGAQGRDFGGEEIDTGQR